MASWRQLLGVAVAVLTLLLPAQGRASPIEPMTLWDVTEKAQLIILARVVRHYEVEPIQLPPLPGETAEAHLLRRKRASRFPPHRAELEVLETWKGSPGGERLAVLYYEGLFCPAPAELPVGETMAVFLTEQEGAWDVVGLSYGSLPVTKESAKVIRARVEEARELQARPPVHARSRLEWNVRAASHGTTRWDGLYPLFADALKPDGRNVTRVPPCPHPLTREAQEHIAASFISDPGSRWSLPLVLMALEGHPSTAVDFAASVLLEALLEEPYGQDEAQDALDLLQVRFGVTGPGTARCRVVSGEDEDRERLSACVRARWERIRALWTEKPRSSAFSAPERPHGAAAP